MAIVGFKPIVKKLREGRLMSEDRKYSCPLNERMCEEGKCAWWDRECLECAVIGIKIELVKLNEKGGG